jgi:uncharacterized small protein (DUF1192 family)
MVRSFAAYPRVLEAVDMINIPELDPEAMTSMTKAALIDWILALNGRLSPLEQRIAELEAENERLKAGGCARDQRTTQYCAEAVQMAGRIKELESQITEIPTLCRKYEKRIAELEAKVERVEKLRVPIYARDIKEALK